MDTSIRKLWINNGISVGRRGEDGREERGMLPWTKLSFLEKAFSIFRSRIIRPDSALET
jgi:hypothetical protein